MATDTHSVFNWQIGREMAYPYEAPPPKKQVAWVFDINKCIACQTCTLACKTTWTAGKGQEYMWWNNVETKPWGFYPLGWDVRLLDKLGVGNWEKGVYKGKTIFEAAKAGERLVGVQPEEEDWAHPNIGEDEIAGGSVAAGDHITDVHRIWMFYLQRICNHCSYPGCVGACSRKSVYKRDEDGIVLIDQDRCRGYQECVRGCPYKKSMFHPRSRKSQKCISCYPAVGEGYQTQCVANCIGKIRVFGHINPPDKARDDNPIDYLVHKAKIALPLYPQFGTQPNVYYIPPVHVPRQFLFQMFGPGVPEAIKKYRTAPDDEKLRGLLVLFGSTDKIFTRFKVTSGEAIGYNDKGDEIVRVPITEPTYRRPFFDEERNVYRHSIT
ncbi:MAG: dehydrogenase [Phycisphaerae bacterium]|jgi:nitrate reductase beta subunit|nr:dehydrogenase [Phycisphaerae bacterium]